MRVISICLLAVLSFTAVAKNPPVAVSNNSLVTYRLFNSNLQIAVPQTMQKEREFYHYWDKCADGGYSVAFQSACSDRGGMSLQVNIHSMIETPEHLQNRYDPRKQCLKDLQVLEDTSYYVSGKLYTVYATLTTQSSGRKRNAGNNYNYYLSYYIQADGRMLEFNYFYWDKDGRHLDYWRNTAQQIVTSIHWLSNKWVAAK